MAVIKATADFNFSTLSLADPVPLIGQSGTYFTQITFGTDPTPSIQFPKGEIKDGFIKSKHGQICDIKYNRQQSGDLIAFLEGLVCACQDKLNEKKTAWFQTELSNDDIETMITPIFRIYQSYKYILVRLQTSSSSKPPNRCIIYDVNQIGVDADTVTANKPVIPLVVLDGIRFSSTNFEICLKVVQLMMLESVPSVCLIRHDSLDSTMSVVSEPVLDNSLPASSDPSLPASSDSGLPASSDPGLPASDTLTVSVMENSQVQTPSTLAAEALENTPAAAMEIPTKPPPTDRLEEVSLNLSITTDDAIILKKPNEIFYSIYKAAREKAKNLRTVAIEAFLEAKAIKAKYMLTDIDDEDDDDDDDDDDEDDNEDADNDDLLTNDKDNENDALVIEK